MNIHAIVQAMRNGSVSQHTHRIVNEKRLLEKCILCKYYMSSQKWSSVLEKHVMNLFDMSKKANNESGDGVVGTNNIEIKVSLGDCNNCFNFVQLRPKHNIQYYLFMIYDISIGEYGKIYWLLIKPSELYKLIPQYGGYAHGTIKYNGVITYKSIQNTNDLEYALRICTDKRKFNTKKYKAWEKLSKYIHTEREIINKLSKHNKITHF